VGKIVQVGMGEIKLATAPNKLLTAGLGSCIGICVCSSYQQLGALAHIMLPSSLQTKKEINRAKFADTAVELIIEEMIKNKVNISKIHAKIAGGAQMFKFAGESNIMKIGERNILAVEENLQKHGIRVLARDVGGNYGRTIIFDPKTGDLNVRTIGHGERTI